LQSRLARFRDKTSAFNPDEIAKVEQLENFHPLSADFFFVKINLNPARRVSKIDKVALAHVSMGGDPPGGAQSLTFFEFLADFCDRARSFERTTEWLDALFAKRIQFFAPLRNQFVFRLHGLGNDHA